MGFLIGDVLVAAAFMSYVGPFLSNYREDLVRKQWLTEVSLGVTSTNLYLNTADTKIEK